MWLSGSVSDTKLHKKAFFTAFSGLHRMMDVWVNGGKCKGGWTVVKLMDLGFNDLNMK